MKSHTEYYESLKVFFRLSKIAYEVQNVFAPNKLTEMQQLHDEALAELEKDNPDNEVILKLLRQMEKIAGKKALPTPKFNKGC